MRRRRDRRRRAAVGPDATRSRGSNSAPASRAHLKAGIENEDGTRSFLVGYLNRNTRQELDIPVGPNNRIEPGRT